MVLFIYFVWFRQRPLRMFCSAPITKRYDVFTLETADGITVLLQGFINRIRTTENGFPTEVWFYLFIYLGLFSLRVCCIRFEFMNV